MDDPHILTHLTSLHISQDDNLDELVQRFWLQEEVPAAPLYTKEEQDCEEHFVHAHSRNV